MSIKENIEAAKTARKALAEHCMAAKIEETKDHLIVYFPPGYSLDGVRAAKSNGIKWACDRALEKMEQTWNPSKL